MVKNKVYTLKIRQKGKGKGRFAGPLQHCSLMADCTLAPK
jgi:hypothetical protein